MKYDRFTSIGICLLTATVSTSVVFGWAMKPPTRRSISTKTQIVKFNYMPRRENSIVRIVSITLNSSRMSKGDDIFKQIDINDVLLEAENALKAAENSIDVAVVSKGDDIFKEIDMNDVLLEAENALKAAENSINDVAVVSNGDDDTYKKSEKVDKKIMKDNPSNNKETVTNSKEDITSFTKILASTIGGSLLGSLLGSIAIFEMSELYTAFTTPLASAIPILVGISLGGIIGFTGSMQDGVIGIIIRNVLGVPVQALALAIVDYIQLAVTRQVEKTTNNIKAIPSNLANSAQEKAVQKANDLKENVIMTVESALEKIKKVLLVVVALTSVFVLGVLILQ